MKARESEKQQMKKNWRRKPTIIQGHAIISVLIMYTFISSSKKRKKKFITIFLFCFYAILTTSLIFFVKTAGILTHASIFLQRLRKTKHDFDCLYIKFSFSSYVCRSINDEHALGLNIAFVILQEMAISQST